MEAKVYELKNYRHEDPDDADDLCIDTLVEEWTNVLHKKIVEIHGELGAYAAYQFHHRLCGTDISMSKNIVDIVMDVYDDPLSD